MKTPYNKDNPKYRNIIKDSSTSIDSMLVTINPELNSLIKCVCLS